MYHHPVDVSFSELTFHWMIAVPLTNHKSCNCSKKKERTTVPFRELILVSLGKQTWRLRCKSCVQMADDRMWKLHQTQRWCRYNSEWTWHSNTNNLSVYVLSLCCFRPKMSTSAKFYVLTGIKQPCHSCFSFDQNKVGVCFSSRYWMMCVLNRVSSHQMTTT